MAGRNSWFNKSRHVDDVISKSPMPKNMATKDAASWDASRDSVWAIKIKSIKLQSQLPWTLDRLCNMCVRCGVKLTPQRRGLLQVLMESTDHPDVTSLIERARRIGNSTVSFATTYRFLGALQQIGALERHEFIPGSSRYELTTAGPHDHMIDISSGKVTEFNCSKIIEMLDAVAARHHCQLLRYKLEVLVDFSHRSLTVEGQ